MVFCRLQILHILTVFRTLIFYSPLLVLADVLPMGDNKLEIITVTYVSFDGVVELWLKIVQVEWATVKAHSGIFYDSYHSLPTAMISCSTVR